MVVKLCIIGFLVLLGIIFFFGKGAFLIGGYSMLIKKQKEQIDTKALTKYVSFLMFACALSISLLILNDMYSDNYFAFMGFSILAIITVISIKNANMSKWFRR